MKYFISGSLVGGVIAFAAVSYGCKMALEEPEFGWMAGLFVACLGVCGGTLVFLTFLIVGLVDKLVICRRESADEYRESLIGTDQIETGNQVCDEDPYQPPRSRHKP